MASTSSCNFVSLFYMSMDTLRCLPVRANISTMIAQHSLNLALSSCSLDIGVCLVVSLPVCWLLLAALSSDVDAGIGPGVVVLSAAVAGSSLRLSDSLWRAPAYWSSVGCASASSLVEMPAGLPALRPAQHPFCSLSRAVSACVPYSSPCPRTYLFVLCPLLC